MPKRVGRRRTYRAFLKGCGLALAGAGVAQLVVPPKSAFAETFDTLTVTNNLLVGATGVPDYRLQVMYGDVGVGPTNCQLHVLDNPDKSDRGTLSWDAIQLGNNATNYLIAGRTLLGGSLEVRVNNTTDYKRGGPGVNGYLAATFASSGYVGIGTGMPDYPLKVAGDVGVGINNHQLHVHYLASASYRATLSWNALQFGNNGTNYLIAGRNAEGASLQVLVNNTADYRYGVMNPNGRVAATFAATGDLAIGPNAPSARLDVQGGDLKVSNGTILVGTKLIANANGCVYA